LNKKLILWTVTVALAGLLFGLDVAVISGAEQTIQKLWNLSDWIHGLAISIALWGTVVGAAFGNFPANNLGRKKTLIWIGIIFLVSSIGAAVANDVYIFMFFRFLGGLSIGASSVVAPVYISEIAPAKHRGKMVIAFQMSIVAGILIAYACNYVLQNAMGENGWRWMLGIVAIPSLLFSILMVYTPESPRWLLLYKKDDAAAKEILQITEDNVEAKINEIKNSLSNNTKQENLFSGKFGKPLLLAFLIAFFNQLSGINAIIYFAPRVFEMAGLGRDSAFLSTAGIGIINLVFTILGGFLIDRLGRKTLMYIGSIGYIISLALVAYAFQTGNSNLITPFIFMFIAAHAIGQGAVIWVFISEIFPNSVRAKGMSFGSLTHWVFAALISQVFPFFAENKNVGPAKIFAFFCVMMILQLLFVWKMMPETKGTSLEDLENKIIH
jgi:MFS transporter, SP family, arabinose:H+ symporter